MTDNEIIKAFKDFLIEQVDGYTDHVETGGERYEFIEKELELLKETDNFINRQKAEIERLCAEVDELIIAKDLLFDEAEALIKKAKSEAYKEFAERLCEDRVSNDPVVIAAKVELKELVGEQNG